MHEHCTYNVIILIGAAMAYSTLQWYFQYKSHISVSMNLTQETHMRVSHTVGFPMQISHDRRIEYVPRARVQTYREI